MTYIRMLIVALCMAAPAVAQDVTASFGHYTPAQKYNSSVTTNLYLPMRDGVRLAVSVTRPAIDGKPADGRFPVIWQHGLGALPAGVETGPIASEDPKAVSTRGRIYIAIMPRLARDGYVVVNVSRRGLGQSFGRRRGYNDRSEAYDSYDVIDWLAAQPWSNGMVGIYGCSNTGDAAMHAVTAGNPHLKAAWAGCFSWEKYDGFLRGGIFANWGTGPERTVEQDMGNPPIQGDEAKILLRQAAEEHQGAYPLLKMWSEMPFRDSFTEATQSRFWYEGSVATYKPQINQSGTAIYIQAGWSDDLRGQNLVAFANLTNDRKIILGPWIHCGSGDFDMLSEVRRFFDTYLKGADVGLKSDDPIHYFTMNAAPGTEWRSSRTWPVNGVKATPYYLSSAGELASKQTNRAKPVSFTVRYDVDCPSPQLPLGTLTGAIPCPVAHGGPRFASAPLTEDTEVTGDAVADMWIASTARDGNVFVYLEDVGPDGKVTQVTDARLKASLRKVSAPKYANYALPWHRSHAEDAQALAPGEPARLTFAFLPTSYIFKAGHRIRVSVAGADFRERDRTPVTPAPQVTLLNDAKHASAIILPIVRR